MFSTNNRFSKFPIIFISLVLSFTTFSFELQAQSFKHEFSLGTNSTRLIREFNDIDEALNWVRFPSQEELKIGLNLSYGLQLSDVHKDFTPFGRIEYNLNRIDILGDDGKDVLLHFSNIYLGTLYRVSEDVNLAISIENSFKIARNNFADEYPLIFSEQDVDERFRFWIPGLDLGARFFLFKAANEREVYLNGSYSIPFRKLFDERGYTLSLRRFQVGLTVVL